jgi:hypothetical protein
VVTLPPAAVCLHGHVAGLVEGGEAGETSVSAVPVLPRPLGDDWAQDSRVPPDVLAQMYPRLPEFRQFRAGLDPEGKLASDLSRRLGL